jgi:hypothetical protein
MANLNFLLAGRSDSGLTQIWEIRSVHTDVLLGQINWKPSWRRYWFTPDTGTGFDAECLREIAKFLDDQMAVRAQDKQIR